VIRPEAQSLVNDPLLAPTGAPDVPAAGRTPAENCARIKDLGYVASKHITMYGERLELVSDPVEEGQCIVVQVISGNNPTRRRLRLPVSILLGLSDRGGQKTKFGKRRR
jgi:hypothetical protein